MLLSQQTIIIIWLSVTYLQSSIVTVRLSRHAGMHVHPGKSSPGTEPRRFGT